MITQTLFIAIFLFTLSASQYVSPTSMCYVVGLDTNSTIAGTNDILKQLNSIACIVPPVWNDTITTACTSGFAGNHPFQTGAVLTLEICVSNKQNPNRNSTVWSATLTTNGTDLWPNVTDGNGQWIYWENLIVIFYNIPVPTNNISAGDIIASVPSTTYTNGLHVSKFSGAASLVLNTIENSYLAISTASTIYGSTPIQPNQGNHVTGKGAIAVTTSVAFEANGQ
jgi:hypothetical protein